MDKGSPLFFAKSKLFGKSGDNIGDEYMLSTIIGTSGGDNDT